MIYHLKYTQILINKSKCLFDINNYWSIFKLREFNIYIYIYIYIYSNIISKNLKFTFIKNQFHSI